MFVQHPFDIAPRARRYTPAAWGALALATVFAGFCTTALARIWAENERIQDETATLRRALLVQTRKEASLAGERAREPAESVRARLSLQRILNLSWSGLFEVLEGATKAVDGRVTIAALAPVRLRPEGAEVGITALAATSDAMLQYLQTVQADPRIKQVQLVAQQPATVGGTAVIRFQAALLLDSPALHGAQATSSVANVSLGAKE